MGKNQLRPFLLIKILFVSIIFLMLGSVASVVSESSSLDEDIYMTNNEIERVQTEIMSKENCFPNCISNYKENENWQYLTDRLAYYKNVQTQTLLERYKIDIQHNDFLYFIVIVTFFLFLIFSLIRTFVIKRLCDHKS